MKVETWIAIASAALAAASAYAAFSQARSARTQAKVVLQDAKDRDVAELRVASGELTGMIYKMLEATSGENILASAAFAANTPDPIRLVGRYVDAFNTIAQSGIPSDRSGEAAERLGEHLSAINRIGNLKGANRA